MSREEPKMLQIKKELEELQSKVDQISNFRPETPWQEWKCRACQIIGTNKAYEKAINTFRCFDDKCIWKDKKVTLNGYTLHLKRKHNHNIVTQPYIHMLPKVETS